MPIEERFGNYRVVSHIASGGMGRVYLAKDEKDGRLIAIKVLPDHFLKDRKRSQYLEREVKIAKKLKHPNVIDIYGLYQQNGIGYLLMEFVDGGNLRQHMRATNMDLPEVHGLILQICAGLHYIHNHKLEDGRFHSIIHKDVKPENILISKKGQVKVADFGLSMVEDSWSLRRLRSRAGTPFYMSPEQIRGKALDVRTDIYSFGLVIYELLTGQLPYRINDKKLYMKMVISKKSKPVPPSYINKEVPHQLDEITLRALENEPDRRYQTVAQMMLDLQRLSPILKHACDKAEEFGVADAVAPDAEKGRADRDVADSVQPVPDETTHKVKFSARNEGDGMPNQPATGSGDTTGIERSADPETRNKAVDDPQKSDKKQKTLPPEATAGESGETRKKDSAGQTPESVGKLDVQELETLIFIDRKKG